MFDRRLLSFTLTLALTLLAGAGCSLSDIRTPELLAEVAPGDDRARIRGRLLLERLADRYGGLEHWRSHETMELEFTDEWPSLMWRTMAAPWP
jgi:hypothetical protein